MGRPASKDMKGYREVLWCGRIAHVNGGLFDRPLRLVVIQVSAIIGLLQAIQLFFSNSVKTWSNLFTDCAQ